MKPEIHPVRPTLREQLEKLKPEQVNEPQVIAKPDWGVRILMSVNVLLILGVVAAASYIVVREQRFHDMVQTALSSYHTDMEQLRTDVVTTSSENSLYLKVMLLKPGIDKQLARDIAHSVALRSREHKRDPDLVLALIAIESNFNPNAVSPTGAQGLTQVMPSWKASLGITQDLRDVDTSIKTGLHILGSYEQTFGGLELALTAYNRGPTAVYNDMKNGVIPTNGYAENCMRTYARIKAWARP